MPYIAQSNRDYFFRYLDGIGYLIPHMATGPGNLNYVLTSIINVYLSEKALSYDRINEVIGVLECAKLELYRRVAAPYEDKKLAENGEVYASQSK